MKNINWYDVKTHLEPCEHHVAEILEQGVTQEQFDYADEIIGDIANRHASPDRIQLLDNGSLLIQWLDLFWVLKKDGTHDDAAEEEEERKEAI